MRRLRRNTGKLDQAQSQGLPPGTFSGTQIPPRSRAAVSGAPGPLADRGHSLLLRRVVACPKRTARSFFAPFVKWITVPGKITGQGEVHRTARADFNVRGWQGRLRHTAPAALFFAWNQPSQRRTTLLLIRPMRRHAGITSGLFLGKLAMVASLTFRCWATINGGVWVIQSDRETSAKYGLLNTSRNCRSVSPVFLI